MKSTPKSTF